MDEHKAAVKLSIFRCAIAVLSSIALVQFITYLTSPNIPAQSKTKLLVGDGASDEIIKISGIRLQELSGMTRDNILALRRAAVSQNKKLFETPYEPSEYVFGNIKDGLGWYGLKGFFLLGPSEESTQGVSSEARFILNPFLLVAPEFWGLSIWGGGAVKWDRARISESDLTSGQFPFAPKPESLEWHAKERYAEVRYNLSDFIRRINEWTTIPLTTNSIDFGVVTYNASDMNLGYVQLNLAHSQNIANAKQPALPVDIFEHLGESGSLCGFSEGCNHRLAPIAEFDSIKVQALPATAVFDLWDEEGDDLEEPFFTFIIHLE